MSPESSGKAPWQQQGGPYNAFDLARTIEPQSSGML